MEHMKFWASALLYDNKIKTWKISPNKKDNVADFYKAFYYMGENMLDYIDNPKCRVENKLFEESDEITNSMIFDELAPNWFSQWELIDDYKGDKPYGKEKETIVDIQKDFLLTRYN